MRNRNGFSEFEFLGLVAIGLLIAGLLAHFIFDQSIQLEKMKALVHRDGVRLNLETHLLDVEVIKKSIQALPDDLENQALRACILGDEGNKSCAKKSECCVSRMRKSIPIYRLGDDKKLVAGSETNPACLNQDGESMPETSKECFASARVSLEAICAGGVKICRQASAVLIRYQIQFMPAFLKGEPELSTLERSISLILEKKTEPESHGDAP